MNLISTVASLLRVPHSTCIQETPFPTVIFLLCTVRNQSVFTNAILNIPELPSFQMFTVALKSPQKCTLSSLLCRVL